jgi:hypothetical protein
MKLVKYISGYCYLLICIYSVMYPVAAIAEEPLEAAIKDTVAGNEEARQAQVQIEKLDDQTRDLAQEYRDTLEQTDSLKIYNGQLEKLIKKQQEDLASIAKQVRNVDETQRNIVPLMLRMIDVLEKFMALDMPFLKKERTARLQTIKEIMDRPDVTIPEKFRRIMEAYQVELEYGRTLETMTDTIDLYGAYSTVNLLRIGRIALLYQTLDGKNSGYWDKKEKTWKKLDNDYNKSIRRGIQIARRQSTPDFFTIPLAPPENVK